jgi:hypothetical protein
LCLLIICVVYLARRKKKWNGPLQYEDRSGELMMLPGDMALLWDRKFKKYVELYAKDEDTFFKVRGEARQRCGNCSGRCCGSVSAARVGVSPSSNGFPAYRGLG